MSPEQCLRQPVTAASDIYSLGCLLHELLTGDVPFHATVNTSLRAHHLRSAPPSVRSRRADVPPGIDALVTAMLAKEPSARPSAVAVYDALAPAAAAPATGAQDDRDPTRPFRRPLLAPVRRRHHTPGRGRFTDADLDALRRAVRTLLDDDRPAEAIRLIEDGLERVGDDRPTALTLNHLLAAALFYTGEYSRAAQFFDAAGRDYRRYLRPTEPLVLDCAYHAGHAYAEVGKPDKALPQLRFYLQNSVPADDDEAAKVRESRFVVAQLLAATGEVEDARAELTAIRPMLIEAFGAESTQVRNVDKQVDRLGPGAADT